MGRPSSFTDELAREICDRLSTGETLVDICRDPHMPAVRTVSDWRDAHQSFSADFARARDDGFDAIAADCLRIADTPVLGEETLTKGTAEKPEKEVRAADMLGHRKLQIDTRLKLLARWDPRRYGENRKEEGGINAADAAQQIRELVKALDDETDAPT
jgi:hypothetical protein